MYLFSLSTLIYRFQSGNALLRRIGLILLAIAFLVLLFYKLANRTFELPMQGKLKTALFFAFLCCLLIGGGLSVLSCFMQGSGFERTGHTSLNMEATVQSDQDTSVSFSVQQPSPVPVEETIASIHNEEKDVVYIRVYGHDVFVYDYLCDSMDSFLEILKELPDGKGILLVDDYAEDTVFSEIEKMLKERGSQYIICEVR